MMKNLMKYHFLLSKIISRRAHVRKLLRWWHGDALVNILGHTREEKKREENPGIYKVDTTAVSSPSLFEKICLALLSISEDGMYAMKQGAVLYTSFEPLTLFYLLCFEVTILLLSRGTPPFTMVRACCRLLCREIVGDLILHVSVTYISLTQRQSDIDSDIRFFPLKLLCIVFGSPNHSLGCYRWNGQHHRSKV